MNNLIIKGNIDNINKEERIFSGWGSIEIVDKQGDYISINTFRPVIEKLLSSGYKIPIQDSHTNHNCGEVLKIEFLNNSDGQPGIFLTSKIYSRFPSDDDIWNAIKSGEYQGYSLGGKAGSKTPVCNENGCYNLLENIEIWEFSIVAQPANPGALITGFNKLAKSHQVYKAYPITKYIRQCGSEWCVYSEEGRKLGTHSSKEGANEQLGAIEVNKTEEIIKYRTYRGGLLIDHDTEESVAPDGSRKPLTEKEHAEMVRTEEKLKKARVYVKNPAEVPSGLQVHVGPEGGKYYETEEIESRSQREKVERQQRTPKIDIKPIAEVVGSQQMDNDYNKEVLPLLETYGKIATGKASDDEVNEVAEIIKRRIGNVVDFYVETAEIAGRQNYPDAQKEHEKIADTLKNIQNQLNTAQNRKDKVIAIDNFMGTAHTSGDNVVRRLWGRPSYTGDVASKYLQYLREELGKGIQKARVYVKNPSQVPSGHKVSRGPHGGYYYETEQRTAAQEIPQEQRTVRIKEKPKRNISALNPRIYDNYDKLLHFETGKEVLLSYLRNTEKAPDMGSRFGQDIEPLGKYVIIDELGQDALPGWEKKAQILYNPLVLDWKNWKQRLSEFYNGKTGKNLSAALIEDGFDSIVTIDDQNVSEIVLLKPKISSYDELKTTKNYKGTMTVKNEQNQDIEHDIFQFENVNIEVPTNDIPDGAHLKVLECSEAFKYSLLKKPPVVRFLGKSYHSKFKWEDRDGQEHESEYGGTADYTNDEIAIYDNFALYGILHHEVGHFVYKRIMDNVSAIPETSIKALTDVDKIEDYNNTLQILKNHNITLNENLINSILDNVDTVRTLGIMDDLHAAKLAYYDNAYGVFCAMRDRMRAGYTPELSDFEIKQWKKWQTLRDAELKSQELRNEWLDIWKTEGYKDKEYANRNNGETFAEFYQTLDQRLRNPESHIGAEQLSEIQKNHPLKYGFFKKHVLKKWL